MKWLKRLGKIGVVVSSASLVTLFLCFYQQGGLNFPRAEIRHEPGFRYEQHHVGTYRITTRGIEYIKPGSYVLNDDGSRYMLSSSKTFKVLTP